MSKKKKPTMAPYRPEEEAYLRRWSGTKVPRGFFEKMESDPAYKSAVTSRTDETGGHKMGTHWGIGKPKAPK